MFDRGNIQKFTEEIKTGKNFLFRFFAFFVLVFLFGEARNYYTNHRFGYGLLISDGYVEYGMYALACIFVLLTWDKLKKTSFRKNAVGVQILWFITASFWFFIPLSFHDSLKNTHLILLEYAIFFLGNFLLFLSVFGVRFFKEKWFQITTFIVILLPLKLAPVLIDHFWEISSKITMYGLKLLLPLLRVEYSMDMGKFMVEINHFRAFIGPPCAGIHSLLAFTVLFLFALFLFFEKAKKVSLSKTIVFFWCGFVLVFLLNSLRVALILLVGAYISRDFALHAFHNNIGAALFLLFFILYSTFVLKRIER